MSEIFKNPLALANSLLYEKPDFGKGFYDRYKEGYAIDNDQLRINKGRMDDIIDYYGVWNDDSNYSKGYMGFIEPRQFVEATAPDPSLIDNETTPLDLEKLNNTNYHPFLKINRDSKGNAYIVGHEGRHRLNALARAGVKKVPIIFEDVSSQHNKNNVQPQTFNGMLGGQKYDNDSRGKSIPFENLELTPINYKNASTLWSRFGNIKK